MEYRNLSKILQKRKIQLALIAILAIASYINIFQNQFVIDDKTFIVSWDDSKSLANIPKLLAGSLPAGHEGVYRPIRSLIYALYYQIFGTNPFGYHLHSLLVHLASTLLIYFISFKVTKKQTMAFIAGLLFATHPIHTETITYIASSMDVTGIVLFLAAFYLYLKTSLLLSVILATLAFFTNETTLTLPILIMFYDWCFENLSIRKFIKKAKIYALYYLPAIFYVLIRFLVLHISGRGPYLADSIYLTFLTMTKVFIKYLSLTLLPINQASNHIISKGIEAFVYRDYQTEAISAQSIFNFDILVYLLIFIIIFIGAIKLRKKFPVLTFGIGWFFIALLPVSEIIPQGSILNERFLYIPSFGFILILASLLGFLIKSKFKVVALASVILIVASYSYLTFSRNRDWRDAVTLWSKDVAIYPDDNAYGYFALGNAYAEQNAQELAIINYQQSFKINPKFVVTLGSIARTYTKLGKLNLAEDYYKRALLINPNFWEAHLDLARIYSTQAEFNLARVEYQQLLQIYPNYSPTANLLSNLPTLQEATSAGNLKDDKVWLKYRQKSGMSISYPSTWHLTDKGNSLVLTDPDNQLKINIVIERKESKELEEDYLKTQTEQYGELINQGLADVPFVDRAYVRVWEDSGVKKLQFFLFKDKKVVKILVYPWDSPQMSVFDMILGSIKLP